MTVVPRMSVVRRALGAVVLAVVALLAAACGGGAPERPEFVISAIPDQDPQELQRLYGLLSERLSAQLGVDVRYVPLTDYAASVTAFRRGDLDMVFFGGLTGVQARTQVPGAVPLAQRDIDEDFQSVFIAGPAAGIPPIGDVAGLQAIAGRSITFGSESSTSGRLMPQYFLDQAGVPTTAFRGPPGFSGSHDATIAVVASGAYEVGALNRSVWDSRVAAGAVDPTRVVEIFRTPEYHDYHWVIRPDVDERLGAGFTERVRTTLLGMTPENADDAPILELFEAERFVPTEAANYAEIEQIGRELGLIR